MSCRLFIDEVGNDDVNHPAERFLSVTGITTKISSHSRVITPEIELLKANLFGHNPPQWPVVLHRKEIVRRESPFDNLSDPNVNQEWEARILHLIGSLPYIANTVLIDKQAHVQKYDVWKFNPYHYCLRVLIERYVLWLYRQRLTGDVVIEPRFKQVDKKLKASFEHIYDHGTEHIPAHRIQQRLTSREIKFEPKSSNVAGLQLVDMIAHPSHQALKSKITGEPMKAQFGMQVVDILMRSRYSRDPKRGTIEGWGQKILP